MSTLDTLNKIDPMVASNYTQSVKFVCISLFVLDIWPLSDYNFKWDMDQSIQSLSRVQLFATTWIAAHQATLRVQLVRALVTSEEKI